MNLPSISAIQLKQKLASSNNFILLDVRSLEEHKAYNLGGILIPLPELVNRLDELDRSKEIIVYCRSGGRSHLAVKLLLEHHFNCVNLTGGILEWQNNDPS